mgnify:FL=1
MEKENIIHIDTIDTYNKIYGIETKHPLVTVVDFDTVTKHGLPDECSIYYGVYAIFLKQTFCGDITYGRQPYDYQEGTVVSFAPGQIVKIRHRKPAEPAATPCIGLLFHPDLIRGTDLGRDIRHYSFFSYDSREALHLSEEERGIFRECLQNIKNELNHSIDIHTKRLVCRNIQLLLDYCIRFYERQFVTRQNVNRDVLTRFEQLLNEYFEGDTAMRCGLPTVKYFAERCFLSSNYFGDLVKKETGHTPQVMIQKRVLELAKDKLLGSEKSVSEISYSLGFNYSQHFNRFFKRGTGQTPSEYRKVN